MNQKDYDIRCNTLIIGTPGTGKTQIFNRFLNTDFNLEEKSTVGFDFSEKIMPVDGKAVLFRLIDNESKNINETALIKSKGSWGTFFNDQGGQKCIILVCDITKKDSLKNLEEYENVIRSHYYNEEEKKFRLPIILVANKYDLKHLRNIQNEEIEEHAKSKGYRAVVFASALEETATIKKIKGSEIIETTEFKENGISEIFKIAPQDVLNELKDIEEKKRDPEEELKKNISKKLQKYVDDVKLQINLNGETNYAYNFKKPFDKVQGDSRHANVLLAEKLIELLSEKDEEKRQPVKDIFSNGNIKTLRNEGINKAHLKLWIFGKLGVHGRVKDIINEVKKELKPRNR